MRFVCFPNVCLFPVGALASSCSSKIKDIQVWLTDYFKLAAGVNISVYSLFVFIFSTDQN